MLKFEPTLLILPDTYDFIDFPLVLGYEFAEIESTTNTEAKLIRTIPYNIIFTGI